MNQSPRPFLMALPIFVFLVSSVAAQTVGGSYETVRSWDGAASFISFGYSVSDAGDVNDDGFDDVLLGAYRASVGGLTSSGSALVYSGADGSLLS